MNALNPFVIFSAWNPHCSDAINEDLMVTMGHQIEARGFIHARVMLVDNMLGERPAFIVPLPNHERLAAVPYLYQLARHYAQPSVLYVDANRLASMVDLAEGRGGPDVERETILGKFEGITPMESALRAQFYRDMHGFVYAINPGSTS